MTYLVFIAGIEDRNICSFSRYLFNTEYNLHGSARAVEKSGISLQTENISKNNNVGLTSAVVSLEDVKTLLKTSNPSEILTIEK